MNIPDAASQAKTGRMFHEVASIVTRKPGGRTLGIFSVKPPPVI